MGKRRVVRYCRCGTRLARDNPDRCCGPCRHKAREARLGPPQVPAEFWETEQMRAALASRHMGRICYAYRHHRFHEPGPLSQELVGGWFGLTQPQLSRIENGPPIRDLDKLIYWAQTLRIPARHLWFYIPGEQKKHTPHPSSSSAPSLAEARPVEDLASAEPGSTTRQVVPGTEHIEHSGGSNRELVALLNNLTARRFPLLEGRADGVHVGIAALEGMSLAESTDLLLRVLLQLDDELGGDALYLPLSCYVKRLAVTVEQNPDNGLGEFGKLSQMVGWLALDTNRHAAARRYFTTAMYAAYETDEPALAASSLAYLSLQETYRARHKRALSLAQTALAVGNGNLTPLVKTMLETRLARAHAGLRNTKECRHALCEMRAAFSDAGRNQEPVWVSYVDAVEVTAQEGACYLDLGMTAQAADALTQALDLLEIHAPHRIRDRVHYLSRLAKCYLREKDIERACAIATQALALSEAIESARVAERLEEFYNALEPFGNNKAAKEFRELFVTVRVQRS
jgi:tetratricopeptide (TPR) repeat protein/transcriptional regulator with XRE-family HTH domain